MLRLRHILPAVACAILLCAHSALAHRTNVFAEVRDGRIEGECYSSGGDPIRNASVEFVSTDNTKLGTAQTDPQGRFSYTPTKQIDHRIILDTGDGHRAEWVIKASDFAQNAATTALAATPPAVPAQRRTHTHERQWRWRDVFSGIGYIFGLAGIALYFRSRRTPKKRPQNSSGLHHGDTESTEKSRD